MNKIIFILCAVEILDLGFCGTNEPVYVETYKTEEEEELEAIPFDGGSDWDGEVLTQEKGMIVGPTGIETYYNLPMETHMEWIKSILGLDWQIWTREDGCKMFGDYIMVAANLNHFPYGTLVRTSLGTGIVVDTGGFAEWENGWNWIDIATSW